VPLKPSSANRNVNDPKIKPVRLLQGNVKEVNCPLEEKETGEVAEKTQPVCCFCNRCSWMHAELKILSSRVERKAQDV
jgi:hypothetical protein